MRPGKVSALLIMFALVCILIYSGCDNDIQYENPTTLAGFKLASTNPLANTVNFPRTGKVIFHFNRPIDPASVKTAVEFVLLNADGTTSDVPKTVSAMGNNVYVRPKTFLTPDSEFQVTILPTVECILGRNPELDSAGRTITFSTGPLRAQALQRPQIAHFAPSIAEGFVPDATTLRVYFTEPIDESTVNYGSTVKLLKNQDELVRAMAFASGNQLVVDPESDLDPEATYTLSINSIYDRNGQSIPTPYSEDFQVTSTLPKSSLSVILCPTMGENSTSECPPVADPAALPPSNFSGDPINTMAIDSTLQGKEFIYVSGKLIAEIGSPAISEDFIPVTIRKGQKIFGSSIDINLGGQISTGYETGDIVITVLTDTNGFLAGSAFANAVEGEHVALNLTMDAVVNTKGDDPAVNALMSQMILGVQLIGSVTVVDGKMLMEVTGFTEMNLMGEVIPTTMSMLMVSMDKTETEIVPDETPPTLRSTTPLKSASLVRLAERIVVTYDEPIAPESVYENFFVDTESGTPIAGKIKVLGAKIIFEPESPLAPNTDHRINLGAGISDIVGNAVGYQYVGEFRTGPEESSDDETNPPLLTSVHPGFYDDLTIPAHFPVVVAFNQLIDPESVLLGETFHVLDESDGMAPVPGTLYFRGAWFVFEPNHLWQRNHQYRVVITDQITNTNGLALDVDQNRTPGGTPEYSENEITFTAGIENRYVFLNLGLEPTIDADGSGYVDGNEVGGEENTMKIYFFVFDDPCYVAGRMFAWVKGLAYDDKGMPFLDIDINDGTLLTTTSTEVQLFSPDESKGVLSLFQPLGRGTIDVIQTGNADVTQKATGQAVMNIEMDVLFNMENQTMNEIVDNELTLTPKGVLSFSSDGRMLAAITGSVYVKGNVHVPILNWDIPLALPTLFNLQATSDSLLYY
jgi:hypothetical protein